MTLSSSTGNPEIDELLGSIVGIFNLAFPDRIRGYYVGGSYALGNPVSTSDLDLCVMFKDRFSADEKEKAQRLSSFCQRICPVHLDFALYTEEQILQERQYGMGFAVTRKLIYGADFAVPIPLPPIEQYTWGLMNGAYQVIAYLRSEEDLSFPLDYPDPQGKFYGYDRPIRLRDGTIREGTKQLVNNVCLAASAIIVYRTNYHVRDKHECIRLYKAQIGDEWADFIRDLYKIGRNEWAQVIPEDEAAQGQFRQFCRQAVLFERHFLMIYRDYLGEVKQSRMPEKIIEAAQEKLKRLETFEG